ncbi:hypothetical protein D5086_018325 [Populus alba]|uniref:Uncharacterized protein n=1 Tax=Populus alba TaxID=43335 RepID=A0ACC4BPH0_POPAL
MLPNFLKAIGMLQQPLEQLLEECHPSCLVADMLFPWATEAANKLRIPRLFFNGTESMVRSYGVLTNSFLELEPAYSEHYKMEIKRKTWHIGPLSLCNRDMKDKADRGNVSSIHEHECMRWLAKKSLNSVLYICFGSFFNLSAAQLLEFAMALEASRQNFIWVVRERKQTKLAEKEEWLPEGFEKRMEGKGLIVSGWAPQILEECHPNSLVADMMFLWATGVVDKLNQISESEVRSYGVLMNSFHELEPAYSEHYRKARHISRCHFATRTLKIKQKENI